jgi:hypothetical protein
LQQEQLFGTMQAMCLFHCLVGKKHHATNLCPVDCRDTHYRHNDLDTQQDAVRDGFSHKNPVLLVRVGDARRGVYAVVCLFSETVLILRSEKQWYHKDTENTERNLLK